MLLAAAGAARHIGALQERCRSAGATLHKCRCGQIASPTSILGMVARLVQIGRAHV